MRTTAIGQAAEQAVANQLAGQGYKILDQNWKTKVCEIDIVAKKDSVVYFIEVKYRSSAAQGDGMEYIGLQKLRRLHFAAEVWCQSKKWEGDVGLLGASVSSDSQGYIVNEIIELVA